MRAIPLIWELLAGKHYLSFINVCKKKFINIHVHTDATQTYMIIKQWPFGF